MWRNIANNIMYFEKREKPEKLTKYKMEPQGQNHLTKVKKEKDYQYYVCDYCGAEIKILDKKEETFDIGSGGIVELPLTLTKTNTKVILALHNKCLNPVIEQFNKREQQEIEKNNYNHIPRID